MKEGAGSCGGREEEELKRQNGEKDELQGDYLHPLKGGGRLGLGRADI